jgi:hypothetical protein
MENTIRCLSDTKQYLRQQIWDFCQDFIVGENGAVGRRIFHEHVRREALCFLFFVINLFQIFHSSNLTIYLEEIRALTLINL